METIKVGRKRYRLVESLGYRSTTGVYAAIVEVKEGEQRIVVRPPRGDWKFREDDSVPLSEGLD